MLGKIEFVTSLKPLQIIILCTICVIMYAFIETYLLKQFISHACVLCH